TNLLLAASLDWWWAGGAETFYGPATRYLLPTIPFLMIFVAVGWRRIENTFTWILIGVSVAINWMFVLSAGYGLGMSPIQPGWENLPFVVHANHIMETFGAESVWFNLLASSHFSLGKAGAAAITWALAAVVGALVWGIWRKQDARA